MKQNPTKLSRFEAFSLMSVMFFFGLCDGSISLLSASTGAAGWISQIVCFALIFAVFGLYSLILRRFRGKSLLEVIREVYGGFFSRLLFLALLIIFFAVFSLMLSDFSQLFETYAYTQGHGWTIAALFTAVACVAVCYPFRGLARTVSFCFFPAAASVYLILLLSFHEYDLKLLAPVLGFGLEPAVRAGFGLFPAFLPFITATFFSGHFDSDAFPRSARRAILFAGITSVLATLCFNMAVPYNQGLVNVSGMLELARTTYLGRFFQRFESVFLMMFCFGLLAILSVGLAAIKILCLRAANLKEKPRPLLVAALGAALVLASVYLSQNKYLAERLLFLFERYSFIGAAGFGIVTFFIAFLRGKGVGTGKTASLLLVMLLLLCLFTGCGSHREPDEEVPALVLGYDKGEVEKYKITVTLMPETGKEAAPGGDAGAGANIFSVEAPSSLALADIIGTVVPKHVSLEHVKMIVISEELAKDGIEGIIAPAGNRGEIKSNTAVIISKCPAEEYLRSGDPAQSSSLPMTLELLTQRKRGTTAYGFMTMSHLLRSLRSEYGGALALYADVADGAKTMTSPESGRFITGYKPGSAPIKGEYEKQISGMAVLRGDKLVGTLDTRETASWEILNGSVLNGAYIVPDCHDAESYVAFISNSAGKPSVTANIDQSGVVHIDITARLSLSAAMVQNREADYSSAEGRELLLRHTRRQLESELGALIKKTQELDSDVLQLGRYLSVRFLTIQEWRAFDWQSRYKNARINVSCELNIE